MSKKLLFIGVLIGSMCLLTGCWDSVELDDRHIVLDMALDKAENVENKIGERDYYEVTYTIPDIKKLSGKESLSEDVKTTEVTVSPTLIKSIDDLESRMQDTLTFSHTKAIIVGEELLKDRELFRYAMNSFSRNTEFSRGVNILATRGKASEITEADNYQNPMLGLYIMKYFNNVAKETGNAKQQNLGNLLKESQDIGVTTIPLISKSEDKSMNIGGAAVLRDYQLIGWLNEDEMRGINLIQENIEEMPLVIEYKGEYLTYVIQNKKSEIEFIHQSPIIANINLLISGSMTEGVTSNQIFNSEDISEIKELIKHKINQQIQVILEKGKEMGVDLLNIELELYRRHPKWWTEYNNASIEKKEKDYIEVNINTNVIIENTGVVE